MKIRNKIDDTILSIENLDENKLYYFDKRSFEHHSELLCFPKKYWEKVYDKQYYLDFIIKGINKNTIFSVNKILVILNSTDELKCCLYKGNQVVGNILYCKDTERIFINEVIVKDDDLLSSIKTFLLTKYCD